MVEREEPADGVVIEGDDLSGRRAARSSLCQPVGARGRLMGVRAAPAIPGLLLPQVEGPAFAGPFSRASQGQF
jgi:hypothetical protein